MASSFIGLPIRVALTDGRVLEGTLVEISPATNKLTLENVNVKNVPGRVVHLSAFVVSRETVSTLELLSTTPKKADGPSHTPIEPASPSLVVSPSERLTSKSTSPASKQRRKLKKVTGHTGSEADESGALTTGEYASTGSNARKKYPLDIAKPKRKSSNQTVTADNKSPAADFDYEFDFARGLQSFDKKKIWEEIREADTTDPASLLVTHNRKGGLQLDKYITKLGIHENVLDDSEQDSEREEAMLALRNAARARSTLNSGQPPITASLGDASESEANATEIEEDVKLDEPCSRIIAISSGLTCPCLTWKEWKELQILANIEVGPNSIQRIENAARGLASFVLSSLGAARQEGKASQVIVLCGQGLKGQIGLRSGAHLLNKGLSVTALLTNGDALPAAFEFQLRLFSAATGKVVHAPTDLPVYTDLIIDALADNEPDVKGRRKPRSIEGEAALFANSSASPTLSIDLPSGLEPDTGASIYTWSIVPQYTAAVGCFKRAHCFERLTGKLSLLDVGLPPATFERVTSSSCSHAIFGQDWIIGCTRG